MACYYSCCFGAQSRFAEGNGSPAVVQSLTDFLRREIAFGTNQYHHRLAATDAMLQGVLVGRGGVVVLDVGVLGIIAHAVRYQFVVGLCGSDEVLQRRERMERREGGFERLLGC